MNPYMVGANLPAHNYAYPNYNPLSRVAMNTRASWFNPGTNPSSYSFNRAGANVGISEPYNGAPMAGAPLANVPLANFDRTLVNNNMLNPYVGSCRQSAILDRQAALNPVYANLRTYDRTIYPYGNASALPNPINRPYPPPYVTDATAQAYGAGPISYGSGPQCLSPYESPYGLPYATPYNSPYLSPINYQQSPCRAQYNPQQYLRQAPSIQQQYLPQRPYLPQQQYLPQRPFAYPNAYPPPAIPNTIGCRSWVQNNGGYTSDADNTCGPAYI